MYEYKVIQGRSLGSPGSDRERGLELLERILNNYAAEGWRVVAGGDYSTFVLERKKSP